jgi:hypothetical protein
VRIPRRPCPLFIAQFKQVHVRNSRPSNYMAADIYLFGVSKPQLDRHAALAGLRCTGKKRGSMRPRTLRRLFFSLPLANDIGKDGSA